MKLGYPSGRYEMRKEEEFEDLIDQWHSNPDDKRPLHTVLGMTWEEYREWAARKRTDRGSEAP